MKNLFLKMYVKSQELLNREEGQDLVEYALIIALISVVLVGSLQGLQGAISGVFTSIGGSL